MIGGVINHPDLEVMNWDLHYYIPMAEASPHIHNDIPKPFAYRILPPFIAGFLPFGEITSFKLLMSLSLIILNISFFYFLYKHDIQQSVAFLTVVLFMFNRYFHTFFIWNPFHLTDVWSVLLILWIFMILDNMRIVSVLLFVGMFVKEVLLVMIPVCILHWRNRFSFLAITPAVLAFIILRIVIRTDSGLGIIDALITNGWFTITNLEFIYRTLLNPYLPLMPFPMIFWRDTVGFFRRYPHFISFWIFVVISSLFGDNAERLVFPTAIVFYFLIAKIIVKNSSFFTLILLVFFCFACSFHPYMGLFVIDTGRLMIVLMASTFGVFICGLLDWRKMVGESVAS